MLWLFQPFTAIAIGSSYLIMKKSLKKRGVRSRGSWWLMPSNKIQVYPAKGNYHNQNSRAYVIIVFAKKNSGRQRPVRKYEINVRTKETSSFNLHVYFTTYVSSICQKLTSLWQFWQTSGIIYDLTDRVRLWNDRKNEWPRKFCSISTFLGKRG